MLSREVAVADQEIEATTSRRRMRDDLVELLRAAPTDLLPKLVYLTQGKLYPGFAGVEIVLAERSTLPAITAATGTSVMDVTADLIRTGNLGATVEHLLCDYHPEPFHPGRPMLTDWLGSVRILAESRKISGPRVLLLVCCQCEAGTGSCSRDCAAGQVRARREARGLSRTGGVNP